ncbi:MAG: efflux RND transporter periplasmic adaptor subunit [Acidimicrobiia bacterium]|nr:efflux RND transporter periplasmic adaptor subunit [Acidimicrobiia bacterium]
MSRRLVALGVIVVLAAAAAAGWWYFRRVPDLTVTLEAVATRNLEALVSASGTIQPKRQVNISANTMGRVTRLAVAEGETVTAGQFLLEIDPKSLSGQLERGEAAVAAARSSLRQARTAVQQARATLDLSRQTLNRQQELWKDGLTTRENLEKAQNDVKLREADLAAREQEIQTREQQIRQEQASLATTRYNLSQVIINAPMDGIVTRRNIEEGETAVVGTMNNAGTVLLTIADMSVIEAEIEVDETDIPTVAVGQDARVGIDAVPDRTFRGTVTEIGSSPIQGTSGQTAGSQRATSFKVVITLDEAVPDVRPGFTCTAEIITATRAQVLAVPIQALTVREMLYNVRGDLVREPPPSRERGGSVVTPTVTAAEPPGHTRRETEGVFLFRGTRAVFTPVRTGIAGERYFEVLDGIQPGDLVITGPFTSVRQLADGEAVAPEGTAQGR